MVGGDFNEILYSFEKGGGVVREGERMERFRETLEQCQCEDLGFTGSWLTWERGNFENNNIRERFDCFVANMDWWMLFPNYRIFKHLGHFFFGSLPIIVGYR